jgi:hypothetical protein
MDKNRHQPSSSVSTNRNQHIGNKDSLGASNNPAYKEYLRSQFIYKQFEDLNLEKFPPLVSSQVPLLKILTCGVILLETI